METSQFFTCSDIFDLFHLKAGNLLVNICVSSFSFPFGIFCLFNGFVELLLLHLVHVQKNVQSCLVLSSAMREMQVRCGSLKKHGNSMGTSQISL